MECVIIPQQYKGVVLPREALVTKEQGSGVFVLETKKTVWHPVSLVGEAGNKIVVEGLGPTQEVITNPQWIEDK